MSNDRLGAAVIFGMMFFAAIFAMAVTLGSYLMRVKGLDRTVTVKGLSEREVPADSAIWPAFSPRLETISARSTKPWKITLARFSLFFKQRDFHRRKSRRRRRW